MTRKNFARSTIAVAVLASLGAYAHFGAHLDMPGMNHSDAAILSTATAPTATIAPALTVPLGSNSATDFSGIVERYGPAVVNISVIGKGHQSAAAYQSSPDDELPDFFKRFGIPGIPDGAGVPGGQQPNESPVQHGLGSGFVVSADGLILTNAHVVDGADEVTVKLTDRREFRAKVLGADKQSDVAVLKINANNLPIVKFGNPNASHVGEPVLAIGSPYGFENTATSGIISAKARSLPDGTYVPFLQTDVAVNPGNSGGPLFNLQGEVIGINSQIYSQTGGYQGLSFAIPIDIASGVEQQLVKYGKVTRGHLGIGVQEVTQALGNSFGLKSLQGALVSSVEANSPAEHAGLQAGDVIVKIGDHDISRSTDLSAQIAVMKPGSSAKLEVIRNGSAKTLNATIGEAEAKTVAMNSDNGQKAGKLGLAVRALGKEEQQQASVSGGLLVENASGPAARAGIQAGDIIVSANGTAITNVQQLQTVLGHSGKNIALLVQRENARIFIPVDIG